MTSSSFSLDIQGHRGARGLFPENTLPAFSRALEIGVTTLELDCGVTKDGVVVVSHDPLLNPDFTRDARAQWLERTGSPIWHLTYAELQHYDVGRLKPGTAYAQRFPQQRAVDDTPIPRLEDVFALVRRSGNASVRFNIETKISPLQPSETATPDAFVGALLQVIREAGMEQRVSIQSFDWRTLQRVQKEAPSIPTVYLTAERSSPRNIQRTSTSSRWTAGHHVMQYAGSIPGMVKAAGGSVWSPDYNELTRETLKEAQALGLKVVTWTVNAEADMRRLIEWGVDGIISDYPDVLIELVREHPR
ncbi:MAG: glycerophosphodiester phosphodiesterase [Burkholderiales bacterium]